MMGPSCAVADVRGDKATVWTGTQGPYRTRQCVGAILGVPEQNVRIIYREGSGCYGRLSPDDVAEDAAHHVSRRWPAGARPMDARR